MNNAQKSIVSVIMAVYNGQAFIGDAIRSVLCQSYADLELLIINDGSEDSTEEIILQTIGADVRVRYFKQCNSGVSAARNVGLANMNGSYFCFLDADDVLPVNSLRSRLNCFKDGDVSFADGRVVVYDATMQNRISTWTPDPPDDILKSLLRLDGRCFFGPTWMFRRAPAVIYRFDEGLTHGEDLWFYICYSHLGKYSFTNQVVLNYRKSDVSAMNNVVGLANGYTLIKSRIKDLPTVPSILDVAFFSYRSRRIIFLSLLSSGKLWKAVKYLMHGLL